MPSPTRRIIEQFDLFPRRIEIDRLDPQTVVGGKTRVQAVYRVRYPDDGGLHQVFHDRHGWYCSEHGTGCESVRDVVARSKDATAI